MDPAAWRESPRRISPNGMRRDVARRRRVARRRQAPGHSHALKVGGRGLREDGQFWQEPLTHEKEQQFQLVVHEVPPAEHTPKRKVVSMTVAEVESYAE